MQRTDSPPARDARPVLLVTGASSGIGRATAVELARRDHVRILLVARRADALERTIELARLTAGDDVLLEALTCDLADPAQLAALVADVTQRCEQLDALVNNAGVGSACSFEDPAALADADAMIALNLRAPIALVHGLLPLLLRGRGTIVNVSSVAGLVGTPDSAVYSTTKWALTGFSEAMRARLAPAGIRVVCVQPGPVPTPGWPHARFASRPIARRLLTASPESIARTIARATRGRGGPAPVRPRVFASIPLLRGLAPWLVRLLLAAGMRSGVTAASTGRELPGEATT